MSYIKCSLLYALIFIRCHSCIFKNFFLYNILNVYLSIKYILYMYTITSDTAKSLEKVLIKYIEISDLERVICVFHAVHNMR